VESAIKILPAILLGTMLVLSGCSDKDDVPYEKLSEEDTRMLEESFKEDEEAGTGQKAPSADVAEEAVPPEGKLGIYPPYPVAGDVLRLAFPSGVDREMATVQWYLNDAPVTGLTSMSIDIAEEDIKKGDTVYAVAYAEGAELVSGKVTVRNSPPEFKTVRLMPRAFKPGDRLYVEAIPVDLDGDKVVMQYEWTVNGLPAGTDKEVGVTIKRGDELTVRIVAYDGEDYGQEAVLDLVTDNLPPVIDGHYEFTFDGTTYTYQTRASDPDGDTLAFGLESGPEGMAIDPKTGKVTWQVPGDFVGTINYLITVEDGAGGSAQMEQGFKLSLE